MIKNILKENNIKITKQRIEILNILMNLNDNATIKNIVNKSTICNKSTIYRILEALYNKNIIDKDINYNSEIYYFIKEKHTHYLTCIKCHKKIKITNCPIEIIENNLEQEGYKVLNHKIELQGLCKNCN